MKRPYVNSDDEDVCGESGKNTSTFCLDATIKKREWERERERENKMRQ